MRKWPVLTGWILLGMVAIAATIAVFPRAFPLYPKEWTVTRGEAVAIALEGFPELGEAVESPYVVAELNPDLLLEKQLREALGQSNLETLRSSALFKRHFGWRVSVYAPGARTGHWTYRAQVSPDGVLTSLRLKVPEQEEADPIDSEVARSRADAFLQRMGFDLARFEEPEVRRVDLRARTDSSVRYRDGQQVLGDEVAYGVEVGFAGDRLTGFGPWMEDPEHQDRLASLQGAALLINAWIIAPFLIVPFVAFFFLRRYHAGEVGVRRAVQVFAVVFLAGALHIVLAARGATEGAAFGVLSRVQWTWAWTIQLIVLWFPVLALVAALSWSVGEVRCRQRWGQKLAAFDALFQGHWNNATVARSALRGFALGPAVGAGLLLVLLALGPVGVVSHVGQIYGPWWQNAGWSGLTQTLFGLALRLHADLFALLFTLPWVIRRLGTWGGAALVVGIESLVFWPAIMTDPTPWFLLFSVIRATAVVVIFLRYDLLSALLASLGSELLIPATSFLLAADPFLKLQGALPLVAVGIPLALSARYLTSTEEFHYRYEDIPPHVRRIAERERQRVELETARRIQSSILPDLPPQLAGVDLAHAYLPASEVGGDFYDVMALGDGRLAVAVGDVAGHGVSSGLIMSMAKSTLALQVTFDPEVESVLTTLNRTVYQSARLRLLTTLCYALVDREHLELTYASAGHLAPYRIDTEGRVEAFQAESYPLGVRDHLDVHLRKVRLDHGDRIFLFSDGVVEARRNGSEELFGFDRLEESLHHNASRDARGLCDGVLEDLRKFSDGGERHDDQTILVLGLP